MARPTFTACPNMNHRRRGAPVSHCPDCGGVVNPLIAAMDCADAKHAVSRRQGRCFCVDCGTRLLVVR
jgi:hypothetical protein